MTTHDEELDWLQDADCTLQHLVRLQYRSAENFNQRLLDLSDRIEQLQREIIACKDGQG